MNAALNAADFPGFPQHRSLGECGSGLLDGCLQAMWGFVGNPSSILISALAFRGTTPLPGI